MIDTIDLLKRRDQQIYMMNAKVRTRYAPSPTGMFHVGGARTALFNYLFAKHYRGDFIVRIEDTDIERNVKDGVESQLDNLKWLGIFADESPINPGAFGPYQQSEKLDVYRDAAQKLISEGKAYYCFCDQQTLEQMRHEATVTKQTPKYDRRCLNLTPEAIQQNLENKVPFAIRIKLPAERNFEWNDLIRGKISIPSSSMNDIIIIKNNGIATYNFAVVVDDLHMQITHVIRGEEHLTNTAYQLYITECLEQGRTINYGHLSVITDFDGKKLSKRSGREDCFIETYRKLGYLPDAVVNFLLLLGWSSPDKTTEIFDLDQVVSLFETKNISGAPTTFDPEKLNWLNHEYIKKMSDASYVSFVERFLEPNVLDALEKKDEALLLFKKQISYAKQINGLLKEFFPPEIMLDALQGEFDKLGVTNQLRANLLNTFKNQINSEGDWTPESVHKMINATNKASGLGGAKFFHSLRLVLSGQTHGPEFTGLVYVLGKKRCLELVEKALARC